MTVSFWFDENHSSVTHTKILLYVSICQNIHLKMPQSKNIYMYLEIFNVRISEKEKKNKIRTKIQTAEWDDYYYYASLCVSKILNKKNLFKNKFYVCKHIHFYFNVSF